MEEFKYELKIPKERIAIIIGTKGETKKELENEIEIEINIDSKEGDVTIKGKDPLKLFLAKDIITAIGRGFNPEIARLMLKQDFILEIINMKDFTKNKETFLRQKGRVIGKEGKTRKVIENLTGTYISVFGKTISVIGEADDVMATRKAIESLLRGAKHGNVYKALEKRKKIGIENDTTYSP